MARLTGAERNKLVAGRKRITTTGDYKHGRTRVVRGKTQYWNANSGRWQNTKPGPKISKSDYKSTTQKENTKTRAEKLKSGMATFREDTGAQKVLNAKMKAKEGGASNYVTTPSPSWTVKNKDGGGDTKSSGKKMHMLEKRNRERLGDTAVERLKQRHAEWKKARKEGKLSEWEKKWHPNRKKKYGKLKDRLKSK